MEINFEGYDLDMDYGVNDCFDRDIAMEYDDNCESS